MRHTISVLVENKFGVLSRVSGLFSGRGYNIDSLSVGETMDNGLSVMTIVTRGDDRVIEQIIKQYALYSTSCIFTHGCPEAFLLLGCPGVIVRVRCD